jgi:hypothetical protein
MRTPLSAVLFFSSLGILACSKNDNSAATTTDSIGATASTAQSSTAANSNAPVRGTISSITDTSVTVSTQDGDVTIALARPVAVYSRVPARLADVKDNSFVGVTSVPQPDGSQRATEIHIFPEALRGMGEGSRPMGGAGGGGGGNNTMTNGTVSGSQMTNGTASTMTNGTASTMTNGTISGQSGRTLSVRYQGGTQTIQIPANVTVTTIAPTQTKPAVGANVVVVTSRQADGSLKATAIMLAAPRAAIKQ